MSYANNCYDIVGACRPFLPPKNGYYIDDIQTVYYHPTNTLQIACREGFDLISMRSNTSSGIAECQNGTWNNTFFCESMYIIIQLPIKLISNLGNI